MKELMLALMVWASAHTGLPVPANVPAIVKADRCAIQALAQPDSECRSDSGPVAIYDRHRPAVHLPTGWRADNLYHVSILLHELVHHMQAESGMAMSADNPCPGQNIEKPAYDAQIAFLEAAGVDPLPTMGVNGLYLMLVLRCPDAF
jgi:hypothetical protein